MGVEVLYHQLLKCCNPTGTPTGARQARHKHKKNTNNISRVLTNISSVVTKTELPLKLSAKLKK